MADFKLLLPAIPIRGGFVAVDGPGWGDGFHPPSKTLIKGRSTGRGLLSSFNHSQLRKTLLNLQLAATVDLKFYLPKNSNLHKVDIGRIEACFLNSGESAALKRWGGCWIHIHDNCKTYITCPKQRKTLFEIFSLILNVTGIRIEARQLRWLFEKLHSLPDPECLILSWFDYIVRYRVESVDVHNYEKLDHILMRKDLAVD
ncbi:MAG TPA: hypothetical protein VH280_10050 [Verrucomicrobiae bacterium]|nr:hypothetical protein [Verrucomicrobiae bacterium]